MSWDWVPFSDGDDPPEGTLQDDDGEPIHEQFFDTDRGLTDPLSIEIYYRNSDEG